MALNVGSRLGHYAVTALIGEGGMGQVYQATDTKLNRQVALKILPEAFATDPDRLARFQREAQVLASLNHPNIAAIHGIEESDDTRALVLELVEGPTLSDRIRQGPIPLDEALRIARQIAEGLEAAHDVGVIHRDLKPANIKVRNDGTVKVLDFGLAKVLRGEGDDVALAERTTVVGADTRYGVVLGTTAYMSPEQTRGKPVDKRTDVWSFGCVLYAVLTGRGAFARQTDPDTVAAVLAEQPDWDQVPASTPDALLELLQQCMAKQVRDRLRDIGDARLVITRLIDGQSERVSSRSSRTRLAARSTGRRAVLRWVLPGIGLVALVAMLLASSARTGILEQLRLLPLPSQLSVAVLPFAPSSPDSQDQAFAAGVSDSLTRRLSGMAYERPVYILPGDVIRSQRVADVGLIGRDIGANVALLGELSNVGGETRVDLRLIDGGSARVLRRATIREPQDDPISLLTALAAATGQLLAADSPSAADQDFGTRSPPAYHFYLRGVGHLLNSDEPASLERARSAFQEALALDTTFVDAHVGLAHTHLETQGSREEGGVDAAAALCEQAAQLDDQNLQAHLCLAQIAEETGSREALVSHLERAHYLQPTSEAAFDRLADAYVAVGQRAAAERVYRTATSQLSTSWRAHNLFALFLARGARFEEAAAEWESVTELAPSHYRSFTNLGIAYARLARWQEAEQAFLHSIAIEPSGLAYTNLATSYFDQGLFRRAVDTYEASVVFRYMEERRDYLLYGNLADALYWAPGERDRAADYYEQAIAMADQEVQDRGGDVRIFGRMALYHAMVGRSETAFDLLERAFAMAPGPDGETLLKAALIHQHLGDTEAALTYVTEALEAGTPSATVQNHPMFDPLRNDPRYEALF